MTLTSGTKLGPYEIECPLGAGGMGEVYRARDTRLDRIVAVKVLASRLSSSPELKQRMEREARTISSLNHPHICQLYDIGSQDGVDYLVMEFLEGETLAARLNKGAIPISEILRIGIAVAEALAVAHRQGIVHRDLKPGNIMLTQAGAKLMDFGLAKPLALQNTGPASGAAPSFTAAATLSGPSPLTPLTTLGTVIGTIQYMSPEQIEGKEADARSDIFAFGAVLYEMAAGKRPFQGKSQLSLASSILESDPQPISISKPLTPSSFEHVVTTCLRKDPQERYQTAHDIKLQLQWIASERPVPPAAAPSAEHSRRPLGWIAAVLAASVLGAIAGFLIHRSNPSAPSTRTLINAPEKTTLNLTGDAAGPLVLSPDGRSIAFAATETDGKTALWVRPMNSLDARELPGTNSAILPFWSPDSRSLGFFADGKLQTIDLNGDSVQVVCDVQLGRGGAWGPDGVIIFSSGPSTPLMRVSASGGNPVPLTKLDPAQHTSHRWPVFLPDGKHLLYLALHHDPSKSANNAVYYASLDGRENRLLFHSQSNAIYAGAYLLFARGDQLMAQPFNPANGTLSGEPQSVAKGVVSDVSTWHMDVSATNNGLLAFGSGGTGDLQLVWMDRSGKQIGTVAENLANLQVARISPQGDRIALQIDTGENDIWVLDLSRGVRTRLTFGPVANTSPVWSPDGKWIAYMSKRGDHFYLYRKPVDGSGTEEVLATADQLMTPSSWSRDGKYLFYTQRDSEGHGEILALPLEGERKPQVVISRGAQGHLSPDGHWLAYSSSESGTVEIYVQAFGGGQGKWQVSANGGTLPSWSKDGQQLYYMDATSSLLAVPVKEVGSALQLGAPQTLVKRWTVLGLPFYDVTRDGKKILLDRVSQQVSQSVTVVTNFTEGLKK
ncbi:MAG: serine/threonine protein kinase [Acidobacteriaceae bacterium]|nr:serine/threonine protein kinase [Acidobacteriaceae bacterium]